MTLVHFGYAVETATSGAEALHKLKEHAFAAVVTDWKMPGMTGDQLATEIKRRWPGVPVILLTGYPPEGILPSIDVLLIKPFSTSDLRTAVQSLTRKPADPQPGNTL